MLTSAIILTKACGSLPDETASSCNSLSVSSGCSCTYRSLARNALEGGMGGLLAASCSLSRKALEGGPERLLSTSSCHDGASEATFSAWSVSIIGSCWLLVTTACGACTLVGEYLCWNPHGSGTDGLRAIECKSCEVYSEGKWAVPKGPMNYL